MGRRGRSTIEGPALFFVTTTTKGRAALFTTHDRLQRLQAVLFDTARIKGVYLMAYALMPSHFHLMVGCKRGGKELSGFMQTLKVISAKRLFPGCSSIWQQRFDDVLVFSERHFYTKLSYIHSNPVRAGLARDPCDWPFSSAAAWMRGTAVEELVKDMTWTDDTRSWKVSNVDI
jgi:putative transposase